MTTDAWSTIQLKDGGVVHAIVFLRYGDIKTRCGVYIKNDRSDAIRNHQSRSDITCASCKNLLDLN